MADTIPLRPGASPIRTPDGDAISDAVERLKSGGLVALPTETVYGLAADASNAEAVAEIYRAKGRPSFNPLIVHVRDLDHAAELATIGDAAHLLAEAFWPGALTLVLPVRSDAPLARAVTAGLTTVALRCPAHPVVRTVLERSELALAAPSANRSGAISPSRAEHVAASLGDNAPLILDGGPCDAGIESTIVEITGDGWRLLRPGPITDQQIAEHLGEPLAPRDSDSGVITAPGQLASHYAPSKPVRLEAETAQADEWLIGFGAISGDDNLSTTGEFAEAAARLYDALHRADASDRAAIAVAPIPSHGMGVAINDRLKRAAAPR